MPSAVSWLITSAVVSITPKVIRYCVSETAKENCGGTNSRSNSATLRTEASTDGPRPRRAATSTMPSRYTITTLVRSKLPTICAPSAVAAATTASAFRYAGQRLLRAGRRGATGFSSPASPLIT